MGYTFWVKFLFGSYSKVVLVSTIYSLCCGLGVGLNKCMSYSKVVFGSRLHVHLSNSKSDIGSWPRMHIGSLCAHLSLGLKLCLEQDLVYTFVGLVLYLCGASRF